MQEPIRPGEIAVECPASFDAVIYFVGVLRTPWPTRADCPHHGDLEGPECRIEIDARWHAALAGIERHSHLQVMYWMTEARRDLVVQVPRRSGVATGSFALRSPVRPNPIASSIVALVRVAAGFLWVKGLDCRDGTPLVDIKPFDIGRWGATCVPAAARAP